MRKSKRIRSRKKLNKSIMCLSSIIVLNLFGVSYAVYNDNLDMITSVYTGNIEPYFTESTEPMKLVGNDRGDFLNVDISDNRVFISGVVSEKYNDNLFIIIGDKGSVPSEFKELIVLENDDIIKSIKVSEGNDKVKLHIKANEEESMTQHSFKYELVFEQWQ